MLGCAVCSWNAGTAIARSRPPASEADIAGCRSTRSMIHPQNPPPPVRGRLSRCTKGTRPRLTLSPSLDSKAGSTVSDPSIATATTAIVATPKDANVASPVRSMPAIATRTVEPEISTDRPDEQDDRRHRVGHREHLADAGNKAQGAQHRRQRQQERDSRGDEGAESDQQDDQGQRNREEPGALQIVAERRGERLVGAFTERPDVEVRMCPLNSGDAGDDRVDLVDSILGRSTDLDLHQCGALVTGDEAAVAR